MRISPEVEIALTLAQNEAARRRHEYFTLEHLLYALLFDEGTAQIIRHAGGDPGTNSGTLMSCCGYGRVPPE